MAVLRPMQAPKRSSLYAGFIQAAWGEPRGNLNALAFPRHYGRIGEDCGLYADRIHRFSTALTAGGEEAPSSQRGGSGAAPWSRRGGVGAGRLDRVGMAEASESLRTLLGRSLKRSSCLFIDMVFVVGY